MRIDFNLSDEEIETIYNALNADIPKNLDEEELVEDLHYLLKVIKEEMLWYKKFMEIYSIIKINIT